MKQLLSILIVMIFLWPGLILAEEKKAPAKPDPKAEREAKIKELVKQLSDRDTDVRVSAAKSLGEMDAKESAPDIRKLIFSEKIIDVRVAAVRALGDMDAKDKDSVNDLIKLLKDDDYEVKLAAMSVMGQLKSQKFSPELYKLFKEEMSEDMKKAAVNALSKMGVKDYNTELTKMLDDKNIDTLMKRNVVYALGKLGAKESTMKITKLAKNPEEHATIRQAALGALGDLGARDMVPDMIKLLSDRDVDIRKTVVRALGKLNAREAIPDLLNILKTDAFVRSMAALALGDMNAKDAIPDLIALLKDKSQQLRGIAGIALVALKQKDQVPKENIADIKALLDIHDDDLITRAQKALQALSVENK
ncbi:MAG: HEAT repeat domain-containing protein [Candidatus Brocadiia bacterium]